MTGARRRFAQQEADSVPPSGAAAPAPLSGPRPTAGRRWAVRWLPAIRAAIVVLGIAAAIWMLEGRPLPGRGGGSSGQQLLISPDGGAYVAVEAGPVDDSPGPRVGEPAPDFVLPDLDGQAVQLSSLRGKVVLVNFWATWCVPCRREIPGLVDVYASYKDRGFEIVAVDYQESAETVRRFVREWGMNYINVLDADARVVRAYRLTGLPESFFIDREGIVREIKIGQMKEAFVRCVVEALLTASAAYRPGGC